MQFSHWVTSVDADYDYVHTVFTYNKQSLRPGLHGYGLDCPLTLWYPCFLFCVLTFWPYCTYYGLLYIFLSLQPHKSYINIYGNVLNMGLLMSPPPLCCQYIIVSSFLKAPPLTLFDYKYPDWSITVGYIIGFSSFMWIPIYMVYKLVWTPGSLKQVSRRKKMRRRIEKKNPSHFLRHLLL